jgi:hypothetical protein
MKRTSYTIKQKLEVLREHQPGVMVRGMRAKQVDVKSCTWSWKINLKAWIVEKNQKGPRV